jgi:hypothetical protein
MMMPRTFLTLLALTLLAALPAAAAPASGTALLPRETPPPAATPPSLYSFSEAYRLAVSGEPLDGLWDGRRESLRFTEAHAHARFVSSPGPDAAQEPRFSVSAPRDGGRWPLLLAGLFACAWVAHRRLTSPY